MTARKTFVCQGSVLVLGTGRSSNRRIQQHHRIYRSKLTATYLTSLLQSLKWFWRSLKLICLSHHFSLSAEGYLNSECSADWTLGSGSTVAWPAQFNKVPGLRTYQHVACCHVQVSLLEKAKKQQLPRLRSPRFKALVECRPSLQTTCMRLVPCSDQVVGDGSSFGGQLGLSKVQHVLSWTFMRLRWCWPRSSAWFARGEPEEQGKHLAHFQGCFGSHWLWRQQRCRCSRWDVRKSCFDWFSLNVEALRFVCRDANETTMRQSGSGCWFFPNPYWRLECRKSLRQSWHQHMAHCFSASK